MNNSLFELGELLGQRRAFGMIGGRCSAMEAALMRRIRNEKKYIAVSPSWEEFCSKHLRISKAQANRIIRRLDEFGPDYFDLAQLTRITPDEYKAIAPSVDEHALTWNGEQIELIPENAERLAAAVTELRNAAAAEPPVVETTTFRIQKLEQRCLDTIRQFRKIRDAKPKYSERQTLLEAVRVAAEELLTLEAELAA